MTTTYTYDPLNRLLSSTPIRGPTRRRSASRTRRPANAPTMTDASGTTTYSYDSMDRLTTKATPEGTLSYTYDAAGNLASIASNRPATASVSVDYPTTT